MGWRARFEFKREDAWVGVFWKRDGDRLDLWVCFVPCFPLHITHAMEVLGHE